MNPNTVGVDCHHRVGSSRLLSRAQCLALFIVDVAARPPHQVTVGQANRRAPPRSHSTIAHPPIGGRAHQRGGMQGRNPPFALGSVARWVLRGTVDKKQPFEIVG
jgi:hypothetical protein